MERRDTTRLLVGGRVFHAVGALVEAASPVLAAALEGATTLGGPPICVPISCDAPQSEHHRLFALAVEHAYSGAVEVMGDADALPLWTLAHHLQMSQLQAWLLDNNKLRSAMRKLHHAFLLPAWAACMSRPCERLAEECATVMLEALFDPCAFGMFRVFADLARHQPRPPEGVCSWFVALLCRILRRALLRQAAAKEGGG